jgi:hypothetical protein
MEQSRIGNPETRQNWAHKTQNEDEQNNTENWKDRQALVSGNDCTESRKSKYNKFMTISTGPLSKGEMHIAMI